MFLLLKIGNTQFFFGANIMSSLSTFQQIGSIKQNMKKLVQELSTENVAYQNNNTSYKLNIIGWVFILCLKKFTDLLNLKNIK